MRIRENTKKTAYKKNAKLSPIMSHESQGKMKSENIMDVYIILRE